MKKGSKIYTFEEFINNKIGTINDITNDEYKEVLVKDIPTVNKTITHKNYYSVKDVTFPNFNKESND